VERSADDILQDAKDAFDLMRRGLREYEAIGGRTRLAGIKNVVVWGRVVTATLQKLKRHFPNEFPTWWNPKAQDMRDDPEYHYLYDLRNDVEKLGTVGATGNATFIQHLGPDEMRRLTANPPPFPKRSFFLGDRWGGDGWDVELPDGTHQKFYVRIPTDIGVRSWLQFADPTDSLKLSPPPRPVEDVLARYVHYLEDLLESAIQEFGSRSK
jgi:hypothetical protein